MSAHQTSYYFVRFYLCFFFFYIWTIYYTFHFKYFLYFLPFCWNKLFRHSKIFQFLILVTIYYFCVSIDFFIKIIYTFLKKTIMTLQAGVCSFLTFGLVLFPIFYFLSLKNVKKWNIIWRAFPNLFWESFLKKWPHFNGRHLWVLAVVPSLLPAASLLYSHKWCRPLLLMWPWLCLKGFVSIVP